MTSALYFASGTLLATGILKTNLTEPGWFLAIFAGVLMVACATIVDFIKNNS